MKNLKFTKTHEWVKVEGHMATIGITNYAQESLGAVVFVDLPSIGDSFKQKEAFGAVESVKAASDLLMPVSGKVIEVNDAISNNPELLNEDAFKNHLIKVEIKDEKELDDLMDFDAYQKILH